MLVSDPVSDLLARIRNALLARHQVVSLPHAKLPLEVVRVLKEEGYVRNFKVVEAKPRNIVKVLLKYTPEGTSVITGMKRVSKPGYRVYKNKKEVPAVYGGLGVAVMSTSQGVMTGHKAREVGVGGEVLCNIW